eukprot:5352070-Prymnesium_polylepis.1
MSNPAIDKLCSTVNDSIPLRACRAFSQLRLPASQRNVTPAWGWSGSRTHALGLVVSSAL